jgi:hypothetical protein
MKTDLKGWGVVSHQQLGRKSMRKLLREKSTIRWARVGLGPHQLSWNLNSAHELVTRVLADRDFRPVFGLHDGPDDSRDLFAYEEWVDEILDCLLKARYGSGLIILDAETSNPTLSPAGGWQGYCEIMPRIVKKIHKAGYLAMGPGSTNGGGQRELVDLQMILETMTARDARFDIATVHCYPGQGAGAWDEYTDWLQLGQPPGRPDRAVHAADPCRAPVLAFAILLPDHRWPQAEHSRGGLRPDLRSFRYLGGEA